MATPTGDTYSGASGATVYGGRKGPPAALLNLIAAAPANSWVKANANTYQSAWVPSDFRSLYLSGVNDPVTILGAWAAMGWDDENFRAIFWGGGHANSNDNTVYMWSARTLGWEIAFWPSDTVAVTGGMNVEPVDGLLNAPQSSHCYNGNIWLPIRRRFLTWGGAASTSGGAFAMTPANGGRTLGPYALDMTQAGQGKLGGTTGSNPHRGTSVGVDLPGAQAWACRDYWLDHADPNNVLPSLEFDGRHYTISDCRTENGHDVLYVRPGDTGDLYRIEIVDDDYHNDVISKVGNRFNASGQDMGGGLDTSRNIFIAFNGAPASSAVPSTILLNVWDLATPGANEINVPVSAFSGGGASDFIAAWNAAQGSGDFGCSFDRHRNYFTLWQGGGEVYTLTPPATAPWSAGWTIEKLATDAATPRPLTRAEQGSNVDAGVCGKWKHSYALDCYIGVQHKVDGDIWVFKPAGWVDPR